MAKGIPCDMCGGNLPKRNGYYLGTRVIFEKRRIKSGCVEKEKFERGVCPKCSKILEGSFPNDEIA